VLTQVKSRPEAEAILFLLLIFSLSAWTTMIYKALYMNRAKKLNMYFESEFRNQPGVLDIFDRKLQVDGCPMFSVYDQGCIELDARLKTPDGRKKILSLKAVEHIKRTVENEVARQSLKLESGLILLAIAVSGAPFLGLLGTVWGVMETFARVGILGRADLQTMAPGVSSALVTTVAGLLVAIPSMFGYNALVHILRVRIVELDNFAQEFISKIETEFVPEE
jgi:biopolymer transport protein ExbB/TolQ